MIQSTSR